MHPEERAREDEGGPSATETLDDLLSTGVKMLPKETVREFGDETSAERTGYRPPFDMSPETVKGRHEETSEMRNHAGPFLSSESDAHNQRELEHEISDGGVGNNDDDPLAKFRSEKTSSDDDDPLAKFRSQTTFASQTHLLLQRPTSPPEAEYRDRRQNVKNKEMSAMDPHFEPDHPNGKFVKYRIFFLCLPLIWQRIVDSFHPLLDRICDVQT
jgi:hypothetical protein